MASLTLSLRIDPATGKKDVLIKYESDADALPSEHEEEHRRDRKSTRLNSSHSGESRMPSSA